MPVLATAFAHFKGDMSRARAILDHARSLADGTLKKDVLRAAWMFAVGAADAFFSDAYADLVARTLRAKDLAPGVPSPDRLGNLKVPVVAIIRRNDSWRWRMAARELIEDENVLSIEKIKKLFNQFFDDQSKIISRATIDAWLKHPSATRRLFGRTGQEYDALVNADRDGARKAATDKFIARMTAILQRRHDCIHNCDRPRVAAQKITAPQTEKALQDIEFLAVRSHEALLNEFPEYLRRLGFNAIVRNQASR